MNLALVQLDIAWEAKGDNFSRVEAILEQAPPPAGSLLALPEMFSTGFSLNAAKTHEGHHRPTEKFMKKLALFGSYAVLGGVTNLDAKGWGLNQALTEGPDGEIARYTKVHPFGPGGEAKGFAPGQKALVFDWQGFKVAPFVCYDLRFPELFREAVGLGAELMVVIACWPSVRIEHWETLLKARAIENQCFVAGVNRCGKDPLQEYPGRSLIFGPRGEMLAQAGSEPRVLQAKLEKKQLLDYREAFPVLKDRRK